MGTFFKYGSFILFVFIIVVSLFIYKSKYVNQKAEEITKSSDSLKQDPVLAEIDNMTIDEKVGQMFMLGVFESGWEKIIGGILITGSNVKETSDIRSAIEEFQSIARQTEQPKLLVSVDQEGGIASRFIGDGFVNTAQWEIKNAKQAYETAFKRAVELNALGFNTNFSPVLEHVTNSKSFLYPRVFRGNKDEIIEWGGAMVRGYKDGGIISTVKHFPGHLDDSLDSHRELPEVNVQSENKEEYLSVFKEIIKEENPAMVMTAHVLVPFFDEEYPATLSSKIIKGILREEFGYDGVIITDDMEMGAIRNSFTLEAAVIRAVEAGNDILLFTSSSERQRQAYGILLDAVKYGRIDETRIDQSLQRIMRLKLTY